MVKGKRVFHYVEKRVEQFGNGAHVILPKEFLGKLVRVSELGTSKRGRSSMDTPMTTKGGETQ